MSSPGNAPANGGISKKNEGRRLIQGPRSDQVDSVEDGSVTFTLEEAMNSIGVGKYQWMLLLYVGFAWLSDAMEMMLLSFLGPAAACHWQLSSFKKGAITSVVFIGMSLGAYSWGALADAKGRKVGFFGTALFTAFWGFASAFAPNYAWLLVFRGMVGFGLGGVPVAFSLFLEFIPSSNRGKYSVLLESFWTFGALFEAGLAWAVLPSSGWRMLLALSTIPLCILLILFPLLPESPHYLLTLGDLDKAQRILEKMAKINGTTMPEGKLAGLKNTVNDSDLGSLQKHRGCLEKLGDVRSALSEGMRKIFSPGLRRTSILLHYSWLTNALTYYGLVLLTTEIHAEDKEECVNGKPSISNKDFTEIFVTTTAESIGLVMAYLLVDPLGRLKSMAASLLACAISVSPLLGLSVSQSTIPLFFARAAIVCSFTVIYVYTPEVYPTAIRSFGFGFANAWSRFGGLMAPVIGVYLVDRGLKHLSEVLIIIMCLAASWWTLRMPIETAGRELQEQVEIEMAPTEKSDRRDEGADGVDDSMDGAPDSPL